MKRQSSRGFQLGLLWIVAQGCSADNARAPVERAASKLAPGSVEDCVREHIARAGGDPGAVSDVSCPAQVSGPCDGPSTEDLSILSSLPELRRLDLTGRCIGSVEPLVPLVRLNWLELANNAVTDLEPLGSLKKLSYLGLANNPLRSWGTVRREPFSELPELTELVLDGTFIDNLLPLGQARKLRSLSTRGLDLTSIQSLAALRGLRTLHLDGMWISDLSALSVLPKLRELTADGTYVNSVEPLRNLVSEHRLRRASLKGTCVQSCESFHGASVDCSEPRAQSDCFVPEKEFTLYGTHLAVPLDLVARFAPSDLPVWSADEVARGFEAARTSPNIDWKNAASNCDLRSSQTLALLQGLGLPQATQVVSFGNLRMLSRDAPLGFYWFDFHIAAAVRTRIEGRAVFVVIDPTLDNAKPMVLDDWFARQIDSAGSPLDFSCQRYTQIHSIGPCDRVVDADGNFLVDSRSLLRGAVCPNASCIPHF
jgi:hypothetical protein